MFPPWVLHSRSSAQSLMKEMKLGRKELPVEQNRGDWASTDGMHNGKVSHYKEGCTDKTLRVLNWIHRNIPSMKMILKILFPSLIAVITISLQPVLTSLTVHS